MTTRTHVRDSTQAEVLVQSRRRCCVCFGLNRDERVKKGQIAHLDGNKNNNVLENLAFLCFVHHDEFDSRTSQSKGLTPLEVSIYRDELLHHFGSWSARIQRDELLNFLAFAVADLDAMAQAAIKAAGETVWHAEHMAKEVLTRDEFESCDGDLWLPYLHTLEYFASWGWLTFSYEEREMNRVFFIIDRKPVCDEVANKIDQITAARADGTRKHGNDA